MRNDTTYVDSCLVLCPAVPRRWRYGAGLRRAPASGRSNRLRSSLVLLS